MRQILIGGLFAGLSVWAGPLISATAQALSFGQAQQVCDTGAVAGLTAGCSASLGNNASAYSRGTATDGSVSAYISGGALGIGYESSATATAAYTDTFTFFGGTGAGVLSVLESIQSAGTGSLQWGNIGPPTYVQVTQTFTFGTPFSFTLSASASGTFDGNYGDGGSLLIQKNIESMTVSATGPSRITYADASGQNYSIVGTAGFAATPEPAAWVLAVIGCGLLVIARCKRAGPADGQQAHHHK